MERADRNRILRTLVVAAVVDGAVVAARGAGVGRRPTMIINTGQMQTTEGM